MTSRPAPTTTSTAQRSDLRQCVGEFTADNSNDPLYAELGKGRAGRNHRQPGGTDGPKNVAVDAATEAMGGGGGSVGTPTLDNPRVVCSTAQPGTAATTRLSRST